MNVPEFTTAQAAKLANVSAGTIRQWVARGRVVRTKNGNIDGASLLYFLDNRPKVGRPKRESE